MNKSYTHKLLKRNETYLFLVVLVLSIILSMFNRNFLTAENFFDVLRSTSFLGILAIGVLVVLISGGIDISFTAIATVAQYIMAYAIVSQPGLNMGVAVLISLGVGLALGTLNGCLIYYLKAPAIIVTIATLNVFYSFLILFSGGRWIYNLPSWFRDFARLNIFSYRNPAGATIRFSILPFIWILTVVLAFFLLNYTTLGRKIYALGNSVEAARRSGINVFRLQIFVYCFMGLMAGLASLVQALLTQTVAPNAIMGRELDVIAAVVLGGASLLGGEGTIAGTLLGVSLIAIMQNGLTLMRISSYWQTVAIGIIIIVGVSVTALRRKASQKRRSLIQGNEG